MNRILLVILSIFLLFSCETRKNKSTPEQLFSGRHISSSIQYAELFDVYQAEGIKKVVIYSPVSDTSTSAVFYLVDSSRYHQYQSFKNVLPFPLSKVAVLSSTQLNAVYKLGLLGRVSGIADKKYIQNKKVRQQLTSGKMEEVSVNGQLFVEKTIMLNPQAIFYSPYQQGQSLPVKGSVKAIPFFDFMEDNPLGRAEWIKFTAAFLG